MATTPGRLAPTTCWVPHSPVRLHERCHSARAFKAARTRRHPPRDPTRIAPDFHPGERPMDDFQPCRRQLSNEPRACELRRITYSVCAHELLFTLPGYH